MNEKIGDDFLLLCKQNYFNKVTPSNNGSYLKEGYKKLVDIAKEYFKNGGYEEFSNFFLEGQYFIALWAAHLLIDYGNPSNNLLHTAIKIIKEYSDNPLAPIVSEEENQWLKANENKYKEYL